MFNFLSWAGLDSFTAPKPPRLKRNGWFFLRGLLTGSVSTAILLVWWALETWSHSPYCQP